MGYSVDTTGRVLLPLDREGAAFAALTAAMADKDGWFDAGDPQWPVDSLADLASYAAASVARDGDWLVFTPDEEGDPKWSEQATAFYAELARWVTEGTIVITGEDDEEWSYTYTAGRLAQSGTNGWDGATEPSGEPVEVAEQDPSAERARRRGWLRRR